MNFVEKFDVRPSLDASDATNQSVVGPHQHSSDGHTITVDDAHLLFTGDYTRLGSDLILTKDGRKLVFDDYFHGEKRAALASPDGASFSGDIINALTGHVQYAQAAGDPDPGKVIGHVTKLTGNATVIRNGVSIVLNNGDNVYKGDVVQSGSGSSLGITFIDGTVFGLAQNARMVLNEMVYDPNGSNNSSLMSLVQGTITFVAGETAKHGDMKIDTPTAVLGIRGTAVLVEIGFEVQTGNTSVPVKFQVLQEPDGRVGSYVLYAKSDVNFSNPIATVNRAGEVVNFSANGDFTRAQVAQLAPEAKAIVDQALQAYFPNYTPPASTDTKTNGPPAGSTPATPPTPQQEKLVPLNPTGTPTTTPINYIAPTPPSTPDAAPVIKTVEVTITPLNSAPVITVTPVVDLPTFKIADHVTITDPDSNNPAFNDVPEPYVPGSGKVISAVGPGYTPSSIDLAKLVHVDPETGAVTYDVASFAFLKTGDKVVVTIGFDSRSGPDTVAETLDVTIAGVNDVPVVVSARIAVAQGQTVVLSAADIIVSDPDSSSFKFTVTNVSHGNFQVTTDGAHWNNSSTFTTEDINAGHVRFVHDGTELPPAFSIQADDGEASNHLSDVLVGTVNYGNINDPPTITSAALAVSEGGITVLSAADIGVVDPDNISFTFNVSNVTHGNFQTSVDGVSWVDASSFTTQDLASGYVRFVHDGGEAAPTFSIQADDGGSVNNLSNALPGSVSFTNVNDAPVLSPTAPTLSSILVNAVTNGGQTVASIIGSSITDSDAGAVHGIAITSSVALHGTWQFSTDDGTSWTDFGTYSAGSTLLLADTDKVRFLPDGTHQEVATFSYVAWDETSGTHGTAVDASNVGGETAFSVSSDSASITVFSPANVAPVATPVTLAVGTEDITYTITATTLLTGVTDADGPSLSITSVSVASGGGSIVDNGNGTWSYTPATNYNGPVSFNYAASDGSLTSSSAASLTLAAVNDAPTITAASLIVSEGGTVQLTPASIGVIDPDNSSFTFSVTNVTHGNFQTSADGVNWSNATSFTTADLSANHVRFVHDGGEAAPTFSIQANDGSASNNLSNIFAGNVSFTNVNDAPVITAASLTISEGGVVQLTPATIGVTDPDSSSFSFSVTNVTHGNFQISTDGVNWSNATSFTTADLAAQPCPLRPRRRRCRSDLLDPGQ